MQPDSSSASPAGGADNGATQTPQTGQGVDNFGFPVAGDLDTSDMSDAELEDFVDKSLGIKSKGSSPIQTPTPQPPQQPETPKPEAATPPPTPAPEQQPPAPAPEETKPEAVDIPTLDTSDLWIEVTNTDGEKVRLTFDEGIPDDFQFTTDKQLFTVLKAFNEMEQLKGDREKAIADATQKKADSEASLQSEQSTMAGWANEIQDLIDAGLIPKTTKQPADGKQFSDAEIEADPGLKLTNDVFGYMKTENEKRLAAGKSPIVSFAAAFSLMKHDTDRQAAAQKEAEEAELIKKRGSIVGGSSAPAGSSDRGYVYKRGSAKNIWAVKTDDI